MIEMLLQAERLLVHGMVDQAEDMFQRVAAQDPQNAIAVVGLARVALERGDDRLAYQHAVAALEIDRQNAAALRLEARMSEVFAGRGEEVERPAWLATAAAPAPPPTRRKEPAATPTETERPSERFVLTHNPSMADHRRRAEHSAAEPPAPPTQADTDTGEPPEPRAGFLRRLLGR